MRGVSAQKGSPEPNWPFGLELGVAEAWAHLWPRF